jgi:thymidylate synthase (FAD)
MPLETGQRLSEREREFQAEARRVYQERLDTGIAREQARKDLPLSTYTEAYWKIDLRNLLHFLMLRMDEHAQQEIRAYAATIGEEIVKPLFPMTWDAFEDYRLGSLSLTRLERDVVRRLMHSAAESGIAPPFTLEQFQAMQNETWRDLARCRERDECLEKLRSLQIVAAPNPSPSPQDPEGTATCL